MKNSKALFQQIQSRSGIPSLRPTATVVRDRRGQVQVERSELLSESQKQERVQSSVQAGLKRKGVVKQRNPHEFPIVSGVLHHYDANSKTWKIGTAPTEHHDPSHRKGFKVITWNVWFSEREWQNRLHGLVNIAIESETADVICLQEVTPRFLRQLMEYPNIQDEYHLVTSVAANSWYGVAMLVNRWIAPPEIEIVKQMKTRMGRTALIAGFHASLAIATVHLESLNSRATRSHQLQCIRQALAKYDNALLVGDYNITATGPWADREEDEEILSQNLGPEFFDWWSSVHPKHDENTSSMTFDTNANGMLKASYRFAEEARYDRACLRLSPRKGRPSEWQPGNIRIIGDKPIGTDRKGIPIFVSDHFGLAMEIVRP